jgi:hypothetical protein
MELESHPRRAERVLARQGEGVLILLDPDDGSYYTLDEVGSRIWELCDGTRSTAEIAAILSEEFDAAPETIRADLLELVADLSDQNLVVEAGA